MSTELFDEQDYQGTPLLAAIESLCGETGRSLESLRELTMREVVAAAEAHYGDRLPEIFRIWLDWHDNATPQPQGDL